jgi:hypothetical protein
MAYSVLLPHSIGAVETSDLRRRLARANQAKNDNTSGTTFNATRYTRLFAFLMDRRVYVSPGRVDKTLDAEAGIAHNGQASLNSGNCFNSRVVSNKRRRKYRVCQQY